MNKGAFAVIIPVYNHYEQVAHVIEEALKLDMPVFVVDDGSTDSTRNVIQAIPGITIIHHDKNRGKGAALMTGFLAAAPVAAWAITIDADGQHNPKDVLHLMEAIPEGQRPIVVGKREGMSSPDIPWKSRFGRKFSNFWVWISGGPDIEDSQSGMRIYPLPEAIDLRVKAKRFQFEVEILVKAHWKKYPVIEAPISVSYKPGLKRVSHFHPFVDFLRNSCTFTRLVTLRIMLHLFLK